MILVCIHFSPLVELCFFNNTSITFVLYSERCLVLNVKPWPWRQPRIQMHNFETGVVWLLYSLRQVLFNFDLEHTLTLRTTGSCCGNHQLLAVSIWFLTVLLAVAAVVTWLVLIIVVMCSHDQITDLQFGISGRMSCVVEDCAALVFGWLQIISNTACYVSLTFATCLIEYVL